MATTDGTSDKSDPYITLGEAGQLLGISRRKTAELVKNGALTVVPDPLDRRVKLVRKSEVLALVRRSKRAA